MKNTIVFEYGFNKEYPRDVSDANFNTFFGTSGADDPLIAFCDDQQLITSEQYSISGYWRGWTHEIIEDKKEYFKRKLEGK